MITTSAPPLRNSAPRMATPAVWAALATCVGRPVEELGVGRGSPWEHGNALGVDAVALAAAAARQTGLPLAQWTEGARLAAGLLPERWARRYAVAPLAAQSGWIEVATADPDDVACERDLGFATGRRVRFAIATPPQIRDWIERAYDPEPGERADEAAESCMPSPTIVAEVQHLAADVEIGTMPEAGGERITRLADQLLAESVAAGASDLHIEPEEQGIVVRHRLDGVLRDARVLPRGVGPALASRVKILSGLDIADRLRPQDGRTRVAVNGRPLDLRVSTLPASHGEKIVVRILDGGGPDRSLGAMGFSPDELARVERLLEAREGLILVTGPTGSGKTTTLYAALRAIKERGVNIVTVEDPIEYRIPGIVQVQVRERAGLTFASALRSIMRQDPDVILVGEIRDRETAEIAIQASLTGHLVLSTLHTIDAASAATRLTDMGVPGVKVATALKGVIAQRLLRRVCTECAARETLGPRGTRFGAAPEANVPRAMGCPACVATGYRGRLAVVEVMLGTSMVERAIAGGHSADAVAAAGRADGMRSLWECGMDRVLDGATTIEELLRVAEPPPERSTVAMPPHEPAPTATDATERPGWDAVLGGARFDLRDEQAITVREPRPAPPRWRAPDGGRTHVAAGLRRQRLRIDLFDAEEREGLALLARAHDYEIVAPGTPADAIVAEMGAEHDVWDLARRLERCTESADALLVVLCPADDGAAPLRALAAGADAVVSRPARPGVVLATFLALRRCRARGATPTRTGDRPGMRGGSDSDPGWHH